MRRAGSGDAGHRPAGSPRWAPRRRLEAPGKRAGVVQGLMGTDGVVVGEVRAQQAAEMALIEDDDVVQALPADRADEPLREGILPGGAGGDADLADAHVCDSARELVTIDRVPIAKHIRGRRFIGKSVDHLGTVHVAVGWVVTLTWTRSRRSWRSTMKPKRRRKVSVGTMKKSMAAISVRWASRKRRQVGEGLGDRRRMYLATVRAAT